MNEREKGGAEWYRKGTEAMQHKNWNYAVECFTNCTKLVPDNLLYRQSRVGCIRKSYNDNGTGGKMASMRLMGVRTRIKKSRLSKDWKSIEAAAEEGLLINPWDAQLFFDLGEALAAQENHGVARFALEKAVAREAARFGLGDVPRPPHWNGYRIRPVQIEFWQDRPFRLHDRVTFFRDMPDGDWRKERLYP